MPVNQVYCFFSNLLLQILIGTLRCFCLIVCLSKQKFKKNFATLLENNSRLANYTAVPIKLSLKWDCLVPKVEYQNLEIFFGINVYMWWILLGFHLSNVDWKECNKVQLSGIKEKWLPPCELFKQGYSCFLYLCSFKSKKDKLIKKEK